MKAFDTVYEKLGQSEKLPGHKLGQAPPSELKQNEQLQQRALIEVRIQFMGAANLNGAHFIDPR